MLFVFSHKFKKKKKKKKNKKIFVFCISHLGFIIKDWPFYFYITSLCTLFSFNELIYCTSLVEAFVEHVVWERCLWCLSLCLYLEVICYLTVGLDLFEKGINNHLTTVH